MTLSQPSGLSYSSSLSIPPPDSTPSPTRVGYSRPQLTKILTMTIIKEITPRYTTKGGGKQQKRMGFYIQLHILMYMFLHSYIKRTLWVNPICYPSNSSDRRYKWFYWTQPSPLIFSSLRLNMTSISHLAWEGSFQLNRIRWRASKQIGEYIIKYFLTRRNSLVLLD